MHERNDTPGNRKSVVAITILINIQSCESHNYNRRRCQLISTNRNRYSNGHDVLHTSHNNNYFDILITMTILSLMFMIWSLSHS